MSENDRLTGLVGNAAIKVPCRAATTAAITLSGEQTIDGVACVTGDRVLVKNQASSIDNGIYVCDTGAWERSKDSDGSYDLVFGSLVKANQGTVGAGFWYVTTTTNPIVVGTTAIDFGMASSVLAVVTAYAQTLLDDATAAAARTTLELGTMATATATDYIAKSIIDAAGDLIVGTAADTAGRFALGTAYKKLRVNSGATAPEWHALAPTRQVFTSGSAATYTTPTGCVAINVRLVGGGGGGSAETTNAGATGVNTTFSTLTGSGGVGGAVANNNSGTGGAAAGGDINIPGGGGGAYVVSATAGVFGGGGAGGNSAFGGGGASAGAGATGLAAAANSGGGGGGAGGQTGANGGSGGGAGGYVEKLFAPPAATYLYTVGTGGAGGAAGVVGGGAGAAGIVIVDEYY